MSSGRNCSPDYVFGPRISVYAKAMTGGGNEASARDLVDSTTSWAMTKYPNDPDHHLFLRVMWCEGASCRYPNTPGPEKPQGELILFRGWGLR